MSVSPWLLIGLLCYTATVSYLCRVNVSIVGALMMRDLKFSQIEMGRVFSSFVLGYALFQVPAGMLADRCGSRRVLAVAGLWWAGATVVIAAMGLGSLGGTLTVLLILRFVLGVGEAPTYPAAALGVAQWIPFVRQGRANGIVVASIGLGSAIAPPLLSSVMVRWGWRVALLTSALPALAVGFTWLSVREPLAKALPQLTSARSTRGSGSLRSRSFMLLTASYTLQGYVGYIFVFWFYLYLVQERHFDLLRAGELSSFPWILSIVSIPLGGVVSDRLVAGFMGLDWGRRAVPLLGFTFAGAFVALGARTHSAYAAVTYLALATAFILCVEGPFWATAIAIAGRKSGTAGGVMNMGSNVGGLVSPALTPLLAAHLGWTNALYVAAVISVLGGILWFGVSPASAKRLSE